MTDKIDHSKIRPARGLWAAVRPLRRGGYVLAYWAIARLARDAKAEAARTCFGNSSSWPALAARGWRIIRVDVVPHNGGGDA